MIDVAKYFVDFIANTIAYAIGKTTVMYGISVDDGTDRRILINHGLFRTKHQCDDYIKSKIPHDNSYIVAPFPIRINDNYDVNAVYQDYQDELIYLEEKFIYYDKLDKIMKKEVLMEVNHLKTLGYRGEELMDKVLNKYYFTEQDLYNLDQKLYNALIDEISQV